MKKTTCHTLIVSAVILLIVSGTGCSRNRDELHEAARSGEVERGRRALSKGISVNANSGTYSGRTPLEVAVDYGNVAFVQFLLSEGANPDGDPYKEGNFPLYFVAGKYREGRDCANMLAIAKILVSHGADVNKRLEGRTPLDEALYGTNPHLRSESQLTESGAMIEYLLSVGARPGREFDSLDSWKRVWEKREQETAQRNVNETPEQRRERLRKADQWDEEERRRVRNEQLSGRPAVLQLHSNPYRY